MKLFRKITGILTAVAMLFVFNTSVFAATQETKIGTNNYSYNLHQNDGMVPCFAPDGYCMFSVWSRINIPESRRLTPSAIPETVEGYPVVCMREAYASYGTDDFDASVDFAPEIPKYMQDMEGAFKMSKIPSPPSTIPSMVVTLKSTFMKCMKMSKFPDLSKATALQDMTNAFSGAISASGTVTLPPNVKKLESAFSSCKRLSSIPDVSHLANLENINGAFRDCTAAIGGTNLPDSGLKSLDYLFYSCAKMTAPPNVIPESITTMKGTFNGCQNLTGTIDVRAAISADNPNDYSEAFTGAATTAGCELILNYTAANESAIDNIIQTKIMTSNIKKGVLLPAELPPDGGGEDGGEEIPPVTPPANSLPVVDGKSSQEVIIRGIVEPINTLDIDVPLNLEFIIDENRDIHYTKNAKIISRSPAPLEVSCKSVTVPSGAPTLVADNAFADWDNLTIAQTKANFAISINGKNLSTAGIKLGDISSGFTAEANLPLNLSVLYGKLWNNTTRLTFDYSMNLEFALAS